MAHSSRRPARLVPPAVYLAAVVRLAVGIALLVAASGSRAPWALRLVGAAIAIGGIITPFVGVAMARTIFSWWDATGSGVVRLWGGVGTVLGVFVVLAVMPDRRPRLNG